MNKEQIKAGVDAYKKWYHCLHFPYGIVTPGQDIRPGSLARWQTMKNHLPALLGKSVLDIGAWDGFYSFAAEQEGADVLATDYFMWSGPGPSTKQGFDFAKNVFKSKVREQEIDVIDIDKKSVGQFDVVFFLNVLYHLENPYGCFQKIATTSKDVLLVETLIDLRITELPYLRFIPGQILSDPTNWFIPNELAVYGMFENAGFYVAKKWVSAVTPKNDAEKLARMTYMGRRKSAFLNVKM